MDKQSILKVNRQGYQYPCSSGMRTRHTGGKRGKARDWRLLADVGRQLPSSTMYCCDCYETRHGVVFRSVSTLFTLLS